MSSLWQFFGLPDPEGQGEAKAKPAARKTRRKPIQEAPQPGVQQQIVDTPPITIDQAPPASPEPVQRLEKPKPKDQDITLKPAPLGWKGPISPDGEPFHDLASLTSARRSFPTRALRYVSPDEMHRINSSQIAKRCDQGDTVIIDLRSLLHMDSHQAAIRRDLKMMCENNGLGIFALDKEDKLLMVPGIDVVVDISRNELGVSSLLS